MARDQTERLRHCPTCHTPVSEVNLRARDFQWAEDLLPGRVGPTDIDLVLHQARTGRWLVIEFKSEKFVPRGQQLLFDFLTLNGAQVYVVIDTDWDNDLVSIGRWRVDRPVAYQSMSVEEFRQFVAKWWSLEDAC